MGAMAGRRKMQEWKPHGHTLVECALARQADDVDGGVVLDDVLHGGPPGDELALHETFGWYAPVKRPKSLITR